MSLSLSVTDVLAQELGLHSLKPLKGGRTNRVWRSGSLVIKLYDPKGATPLFNNSAEQEWLALKALEGLGIGPEPVRRADTSAGKVLIYNHIPGDIGSRDIQEVAGLLGRLHKVRPPSELPKYPLSAVLDHGLSMLEAGHPLVGLKPSQQGSSATCLLHRDPVWSNIVASSEGLRLVDWQCPGIGDPVEDLAHFISPGMNTLYRGAVFSDIEIGRFLAAYPDQEVAKSYIEYGLNYHWRMACYCTWQTARGAMDYAEALEKETHMVRNWSRFEERLTAKI